MVEADGDVDVALAGQVVHPLIHLLLRHLGHVSFVDLLATYPVVLEAAPDGGEDLEGLGTGVGEKNVLLSRSRGWSLLESRVGLDVPDLERLVLEVVTSGISGTVLPRGSLVEAGETGLGEGCCLTLQSGHPEQEILISAERGEEGRKIFTEEEGWPSPAGER